MANVKKVKTAPPPTGSEVTKQIEEAAYHKWLDRGRDAQAGDELSDWIEAEKELQGSLKATQSSR